MVALDDYFTGFAADIQRLFRLRTFTYQVSEAEDAADIATEDIVEDCFQCGYITMNVGYNGDLFHAISL